MTTSLDGTRRRILDTIRELGPRSVDQLAKDLNLASATIRRHLDILQRDHLISYQQSRTKPGRPEFIYSLTEEGHESGYRDYSGLLLSLLAEIRSMSQDDLVEQQGESFLTLVMSRVSNRMNIATVQQAVSSDESRLSHLERALTTQGYSPQITQNEDHIEIRLCNCPFRAVALCDGSVCISDKQLISGIMGVEPVQQSSIREGAPQCSYLVKPTNPGS